MSDRTDSIVQLLNTRHRQQTLVDEDNERSSDDDYTPFALGRVSSRPQMMLILRKCTGEVTAYAYSLLTKVQSTEPGKGFTLAFGDSKVQIVGENLMQLFNYVCQHRVVDIVEADRATAMNSDATTAVTSIITESSHHR